MAAALRRAAAAAREGDQVAELAALHTIENAGELTDAQAARMVGLLRSSGHTIQAISAAQAWAARHPGAWQAQLALVNLLVAVRRTTEAEGILNRLVAAPSPAEAVLIAWTRYHADERDNPEATIGRLRELAQSPDPGWAVLTCLGKALDRLGQGAEALAAHRRAVASAPEEPDAWLELAATLRHSGDESGTREALERAHRLGPNDPRILRLIGYSHRFRYGDQVGLRINQALAGIHRLSIEGQVNLHYAAAKMREDTGENDAAFAHYARAGALQKRLTPWTEAYDRTLLETMKQKATVADYDALKVQGFASQMPLLVCGMPRSGTTLVERILACHPQVASAGETVHVERMLDGLRFAGITLRTRLDRPEVADRAVSNGRMDISPRERGQGYVDALLRRATPYLHVNELPRRLVDKMPGNYRWLGLIDAIVPGIRFIHCRRHPIATCLSQYRLHFGGRVPWSNDLRDLGKAYRVYDETMSYWASILPPSTLLQVRYEDVVADLEGTARRIIAHIGLEWDDKCLRFHEGGGWVRTASATQVRRPIYVHSVEGWRRHRPFLGRLFDEIGPLVTAYEAEDTNERYVDV